MLRLSDLKTIGTWKVIWLSALHTGYLYPFPPKEIFLNIPGTHFCYRLSRRQGHSVAGRIMSMKNCNDAIGNRTRELPACSTVLQPKSCKCTQADQKPQPLRRRSSTTATSTLNSVTATCWRGTETFSITTQRYILRTI
jgi:hypothetical protein